MAPSRSAPTIGAGLVITNPYSSGYFAYLGAARALLSLVDELVVVDGGSTDESLAVLSQWLGDDPRVTVVRNETTHWGAGDRWQILQMGVNLNTALFSLNTDWAYVYSADATLDVETAAGLREALAELADELWVRAPRRRSLATWPPSRDDRALFFNLAAMRRRGMRLGYGIDAASGGPSDFPIELCEVASFADPETGVPKPVFRGPSRDAGVCLRCDTVAYGHFYYTPRQADEKVLRWARAYARATGTAPPRLSELRIRHGLDGIRRRFEPSEVLSWHHPVHATEVLTEFYHDGMVGGMQRRGGFLRDAYRRVATLALRIERNTRTRLMRRGPEFDSLVWTTACDEDYAKLCVPARPSLAHFLQSTEVG
ncbi:MAG: glycosyltransferase [Armatimonadetes bacterium]|nr:glycosyltransferase [Armatimonadota bacterium]